MEITPVPSVNASLAPLRVQPVTAAPERLLPEHLQSDRYATAFSLNQAQFNSLTAFLGSAEAGTQLDKRLKAMQALRGLAARGQLRGIDSKNARLFHQLTDQSDLGQREAAIQQDEVAAINAALAHQTSPTQAQHAFFDHLSPDDQAIHFELNVNAINMHGFQRYASLDDYRRKLAHDAARASHDALTPAALVSGVI
ncbi:hypothetical protein [Asticcacaulis taihuensis]|uniref:Uncharacterized protein n=1 Tax=Asticcacaulis taihuensis TaxID=260084 RepID=A0A1G4TBY7_9CAUL|nr:hypothetical protein [Asticcacaulis taihuensis]SCW78890.1 hypothetical protein SAMN02927928_3428 [Asticcacaulis taihuensis]